MYSVFVYGTLKKGFGNHHLLSDSTFIDDGYIKGHLDTIHGLPALTVGDSYVPGELYEVNEDKLKRVDRLEGYLPDVPADDCLYLRKIVDVFRNESCDPMKAFVYYWNDLISAK